MTLYMLGIRDGGAGLFSIAAQSAPVVIRSKHNAIYIVFSTCITCCLLVNSVSHLYGKCILVSPKASRLHGRESRTRSSARAFDRSAMSGEINSA